MESKFFNAIGIGWIDIGYIVTGMTGLIIVLLILCCVQMMKLKKLTKKHEIFMQGKNAKSLEKNIETIIESNHALKEETDNNRREIRSIAKRQMNAFQKFGLIKYDAFKQMGGMLSFSLALLDDYNDGFIINTVHGAEGSYSYTKKIEKGTCKIELGEEEQKALEEAMNLR